MASGPANTGNKSSVLKYHLGAIVCILMWGFSFVSTSVLLNKAGLGPVEIYIYRFTIAYFALLFISHKRVRAYSLRDEMLFLAAGMSSGSIYFIAENVALEHTLASNVSLLTSISPLLTTLLIGLLYRTERPGRGVIMGSMIAVLGVASVIFGGSGSLGNIELHPLGDLLALAAAFSWAVYALIIKRLNVIYDAWFITRKTFFYGVLTGLPFLALEPSLQPISVLLSWDVLFNLLFLSLGASLTAFLLWAIATKGIGPIATNNYLYFQPVVTIISAAIVIHESVTIIGYIGCALIILGVWIGDKYGHN